MECQSKPRAAEVYVVSARVVLFALVGAALVPLMLRVLGFVDWPWLMSLLPFTVIGILGGVFAVVLLIRQGLEAVRHLVTGVTGEPSVLTPAPDRLDPPPSADEAGERILAQHPELLAAICHGFRFGKQIPSVLGRPVSDPWGVYGTAIEASPLEFGQVSLAAAHHTRRFARSGRKGRGRTPSDAQALKQAVKVFRRCAAKAESGRGDPDCTFEHVATIFGARTPSRDTHLKTIAPTVRRLLERQYPQLATAQLADGSRVKYAEWRKQAARDRKELARLRKEHKRVTRRLEEAQQEAASARADLASFRDSMTAEREAAREAASAEQAAAVEELRMAMESQRRDHARELGRLETENVRLLATLEDLSSEREALERALFGSGEDDGDTEPVDADVLTGLRLLLVGGREGQIPPIRDHVEALGVQLLHDDRPAAAELVSGVHVVVLWIRSISHPTADAVKGECRMRQVPCLYWTRTSPPSLAALVAEAASQGAIPSVIRPPESDAASG